MEIIDIDSYSERERTNWEKVRKRETKNEYRQKVSTK